MATGTVLDGLRDWIDDANRALSAAAPDALRQRVELLERLESLLDPAPDAAASLLGEATAARSKLEGANEAAYDALRSAIRQGDGGPMLLQSLARSRLASGTNDHDGYDYLDEIVAGLLQFDEPGPTSVEPTAEMVFYQPTPARHILDLFDRTAPTDRDVLIDLGSGLGHVALMTAICHMYQALGDRAADAANGVVTTAVRSTMLSTVVLFGLSFLFFMVSRDQLGGPVALTAFAPALFHLVVEPHTGWLLSKVYFGIVWLYALGFFHAIG